MRVYISDFYADAVWRTDGHQLRYVLFPSAMVQLVRMQRD